MDYINIILSSISSIVVLFILSKIIGSREISQLSMFDYVNGITIGSIAAEMATSLEHDFIKPLLAMVIYATISVSIAYFTCKSVKLRRFISGKSLILYEDGNLYKKNLLKAKLDIGEFMTQCRNNGYFNLEDIHTAILETNGKVSFIPLSTKRFVTPEDLNLNPTQERLVANVIMDGNIMFNNLKATGNNELWLDKQLHTKGISNVKDVFLATCDINNNISIYVELKQEMTRNLLD